MRLIRYFIQCLNHAPPFQFVFMDNIQTLQLVSAIRELNINRELYTIEILTCDDVNVNHYSIQDIVTWLLASSVHFITGHIHQGLQLAVLDSIISKQTEHTRVSTSTLRIVPTPPGHI